MIGGDKYEPDQVAAARLLVETFSLIRQHHTNGETK